jgi:glycerol dehydrogenase
MATKYSIKETSFRIGSGRYLQGSGILAEIADEVVRLGCKKPFVMGGKTALSITRDTIEASLAAKSLSANFYTYPGFCCKETCAELMDTPEFKECDAVIGVGGGNVMDAAKYCAVTSQKPVINVPTSAATCAAFTPLSVCYSKEGRAVGTAHHKTEVNCVIVDTAILCRQPVRLLLAGVYDSIAKIHELRQRMQGISVDDGDIGLYSSYHMSEFVDTFLSERLEACCADVEAGRDTKLVQDMCWVLIALTGVVSGLARGSNQTAIAHKVYESLRALFPTEVYDYLHGEMVGMGLIVQIAYNGVGDPAAFRARMRELGMPVSLADVGVAPTEENLALLCDKVLNSTAMAGTNEEEQARFKKVIEWLK